MSLVGLFIDTRCIAGNHAYALQLKYIYQPGLSDELLGDTHYDLITLTLKFIRETGLINDLLTLVGSRLKEPKKSNNKKSNLSKHMKTMGKGKPK